VGFTKGQVIDYYTRVAPVLLAHLRDRPLTLKRYPNGVQGGFFYEKQCPKHRPDWVRTERVAMRGGGRWGRERDGAGDGATAKDVDFCVVDDLATLVWTQNLADLELHPSLARVPDVTSPQILAFDLDPGPPATVVQCAQVALRLQEAFERLGLESFPKTSGSKGMQVYVPLNVPTSYAVTKPFALALAQLLERRHPELVVSDMAKAKRTGKVLVDWSQNDEHKTTVSVYSLRARERPTVSTPVGWDEVEAVAASGDPDDLAFDSAEVLARVAERGDPFAPVATLQQELPVTSSGERRSR